MLGKLSPTPYDVQISFGLNQSDYTDRRGAAFCSGGSGTDPVTAYPAGRALNGSRFGFEVAGATLQGRTRFAAFDRRIDGFVFSNSDQSTFRLDLPSPGAYEVFLVIGDPSNSQTNTVSLLDGDTPLVSLSSVTTVSQMDLFNSPFTGTSASTALNGELARPRLFNFRSTILRIKIGGVSGENSCISYLRVRKVKPSLVYKVPAASTGFAGRTRVRQWIDKPVVGTQIDPGNPLSQGLVLCAPFNEGAGHPVNLVNNRRYTQEDGVTTFPSGQFWANGQRGPYLHLQSTYPSEIWNQLPADAFSSNEDITYAILVRFTGLPPSARCDFIQRDGDEFYLNTDGSVTFWRGTSGTFPNTRLTASIPLNTWLVLAVSTSGTNTPVGYINGIHQSVLDVPGSGTRSAPANIVKTGGANSGGVFDIGGVWVWKRVLSPTEHQAFAQNPFAVLQKPRPYYFGSVVVTPAFDAGGFDNVGFWTGSFGTSYDSSISLSVTGGYVDAVSLLVSSSISLGLTGGFSLNTLLNAVGAISPSTTVGFSVIGNTIYPTSITVGETNGFNVSGGLSLTGSTTFNVTPAFTGSVSLTRTGDLSITVTPGFSDSTTLGAVGAINPSVTLGYTDSAALVVAASIACAITGGYSNAVKLTRTGDCSITLTCGISDSSKLTAVATLIQDAILNYQVTTGSLFTGSISLGVTEGYSLTNTLGAAATISAAITSGFNLANKLDAVAQQSIALTLASNVSSRAILNAATTISGTFAIQQAAKAVFQSLISVGVTEAIATDATRTVATALALGAVVSIANSSLVFSFQEAALQAATLDAVRVLVAEATISVQQLADILTHSVETLGDESTTSHQTTVDSSTENVPEP